MPNSRRARCRRRGNPRAHRADRPGGRRPERGGASTGRRHLTVRRGGHVVYKAWEIIGRDRSSHGRPRKPMKIMDVQTEPDGPHINVPLAIIGQMLPDGLPVRSARVRSGHRTAVRRYRVLQGRAVARVPTGPPRPGAADSGRAAGEVRQGAFHQAGLSALCRGRVADERRGVLEAAAQADPARLPSRPARELRQRHGGARPADGRFARRRPSDHDRRGDGQTDARDRRQVPLRRRLHARV